MENKFKLSILSGVTGTAVITGLMLVADAAGLQGIDFGTLLANFTHTTPLLGWIMHFGVGILLAFVYVYYFRDEFQASYPIRGVIFSIIPFVITMILLFPMAVFNTGQKIDSPGVFIVASMLAYFAFGYVIGFIARPQTKAARISVG